MEASYTLQASGVVVLRNPNARRRFSHQNSLLSTPFKPLTPIVPTSSTNYRPHRITAGSKQQQQQRKRKAITAAPLPSSSESSTPSSSFSPTPMSVDSDCSSCDEEISTSQTGVSRTVLPLESFYKVALEDLLLCPNVSFFHAVFSHIFSSKVKAYVNNELYNYEQLRHHFLDLRRVYYNHSTDGVLKFGPFLKNASNGERDGYLAAHMIMASLAETKDDHDMGYLHYNALVVTDTLEVSWVEGKDGESRRITRFDRRCQRPVKSP